MDVPNDITSQGMSTKPQTESQPSPYPMPRMNSVRPCPKSGPYSFREYEALYPESAQMILMARRYSRHGQLMISRELGIDLSWDSYIGELTLGPPRERLMFFEWHFAAETARRMIEEARRSRELRRIMGIRSAKKELPELLKQFHQFEKESRNPELSDIARKNLKKSVARLRKKFCTVHEQAYGPGKKLVGVVASDSQKYCHLSLAEKFAKALMLAIDSGMLSEGLTEQLRQMATPESLAQMAGMFFAVAGVHALVHETPAAPAAWLVDATFLGLGGRDLIISITNIYLAVKDICNERDLRQAADDVASELSGPASGALVNLLLWGLGRTAGRVKQKYELDPSLVILCTNPFWPFHWLRKKKKKKKSTDGDESSSGSEIQRGFTVQEASDGIHYEIVTSDGRVLPFRFSDVDSARIWCEESNAPRGGVSFGPESVGAAQAPGGVHTPIRDLKPIEGAAHSAPRPYLQNLTDDELLRAARNPTNGDGLVRSTRDGVLRDGNGRAYELIRRANDPNSTISPDDLVPVEDYTPDLSMFPDLD